MASPACCALPPVSADYTPKGRYEDVAGFKTYIVGPENPTRAIIEIFDIFGVAPQTLQGADRLSAHTSALVLLPDFFHGDKAQDDWFPVDTEEKKAAVGAFFKRSADAPATVPKLLAVRKVLGERWPSAEGHVGVFGLCFGGKVSVLACGEDNEGALRKFNVSGTAHPGGLDAKDAEALNTPHICLASPGEPADIVAQYKEILARPGKTGHVETYEKMFHGWMGARANLADEENQKEYERGYKAVAEFFLKYL